MSEEKELTTDATALLREILRWSRFENFPKLRRILLDTLKTDQEKSVYELTDGERSRYDIAKETGIPDSTVRSWWDRWYNLGILEPSGKRKGRPQKIVALEDMGIEVAKVQAKKAEVKEEVVKTEPEPKPAQENKIQKSGAKDV